MTTNSSFQDRLNKIINMIQDQSDIADYFFKRNLENINSNNENFQKDPTLKEYYDDLIRNFKNDVTLQDLYLSDISEMIFCLEILKNNVKNISHDETFTNKIKTVLVGTVSEGWLRFFLFRFIHDYISNPFYTYRDPNDKNAIHFDTRKSLDIKLEKKLVKIENIKLLKIEHTQFEQLRVFYSKVIIKGTENDLVCRLKMAREMVQTLLENFDSSEGTDFLEKFNYSKGTGFFKEKDFLKKCISLQEHDFIKEFCFLEEFTNHLTSIQTLRNSIHLFTGKTKSTIEELSTSIDTLENLLKFTETCIIPDIEYAKEGFEFFRDNL